MADEYICKQDAVNLVANTAKIIASFNYQYAIDALLALTPADVDPVVRCKDCLFFTTEKSCCRPEGLIKAREDAFCSYGEREGEQDG